MLTDLQIVERLMSEDPEKAIIISPTICAEEQLGPSSIDVHLGTDFSIHERSNHSSFDPLMTETQYLQWLKDIRLTHKYSILDSFVLHPGEFALAKTLEYICIPRDIIGHIDGRSSWARQGLQVHSTAGNIHPGSRSWVVFELHNTGPVPVHLYPGLAIAQLTFDQLDEPVDVAYAKNSKSKYRGFQQTLWSAYLDDRILRSMRRGKEERDREAAENGVAERLNPSHG